MWHVDKSMVAPECRLCRGSATYCPGDHGCGFKPLCLSFLPWIHNHLGLITTPASRGSGQDASRQRFPNTVSVKNTSQQDQPAKQRGRAPEVRGDFGSNSPGTSPPPPPLGEGLEAGGAGVSLRQAAPSTLHFRERSSRAAPPQALLGLVPLRGLYPSVVLLHPLPCLLILTPPIRVTPCDCEELYLTSSRRRSHSLTGLPMAP